MKTSANCLFVSLIRLIDVFIVYQFSSAACGSLRIAWNKFLSGVIEKIAPIVKCLVSVNYALFQLYFVSPICCIHLLHKTLTNLHNCHVFIVPIILRLVSPKTFFCK